MPGSIWHPTRPCRYYGLAARRVAVQVCLICRQSRQASQWASVVSVVGIVGVLVPRRPWRWSWFAPLCYGVGALPTPQRSGHGHIVPSFVVASLRSDGLGGLTWSEWGPKHV